MDNLIILISSSEEEREERNGSKYGGNKCERPVRSKGDEYRDISDLTGLENVKAMIEAEALMKARRKNNINKRKNWKKRRKIDVSQEELAIGAAKEELHHCRNEDDGETVEVAESDLIKLSETDLTLNLGHSAKEKEDAGGIVSMDAAEIIRANDGIDPVEVIDCCLSSSEGSETVANISLCRGVKYVTKGADIKKKRKRRNRRRRRRRKKMKMTTEDDMVGNVMEENGVKDNAVLRMLLRKPRYFDPPDCNWVTCSACGKPNHTASSCPLQKQKKPCFFCGSFEHIWKCCKQGQNCFAGKGTDYLINICPETEQECNFNYNMCSRCGDPGHDMFSCMADYPADDLKEIQCYMCRSFGHLCCIDFRDMGPKPVSCYKCGQLGHLGSVCTKPFGTPSGSKTLGKGRSFCKLFHQ